MKQTCGYEGCGAPEDAPIHKPCWAAPERFHRFQPQPAAQAAAPEWKQIEVAPESASPERAYPKPEIPAAKEPRKFDIRNGENKYNPCPRCGAKLGMGLSSDQNGTFVRCAVCSFEGKRSQTDEAAFYAWNAEAPVQGAGEPVVCTRVYRAVECYGDTIECSACKQRMLVGTPSTYCPACGARFDHREDKSVIPTVVQGAAPGAQDVQVPHDLLMELRGVVIGEWAALPMEGD